MGQAATPDQQRAAGLHIGLTKALEALTMAYGGVAAVTPESPLVSLLSRAREDAKTALAENRLVRTESN